MHKRGIIAGLPEYVNILTTTGMHGRRRKEDDQA
jgi:hypothetical protein